MMDPTIDTPPIVSVIEAVGATIAAPSIETIMADIELAIGLVKDVQAKLAGVHPSVWSIVKALL